MRKASQRVGRNESLAQRFEGALERRFDDGPARGVAGPCTESAQVDQAKPTTGCGT